MDNNKPLTDREKWHQAERLLRDMSRECAKMNGDIHDLRAELITLRDANAALRAKLDVALILATPIRHRAGCGTLCDCGAAREYKAVQADAKRQASALGLEGDK